MKEKNLTKAIAAAEAENHMDESAVASISNWAFAWLFDLADFGEDDEDGAQPKPIVSW